MKSALAGLESHLAKTSTKKEPLHLQQSVDLLCKLLGNVIENPAEPKYRQVKKENKRVKQLLTGSQHGEKLMTLVGFSLVDTHAEYPDVKLGK